MYSRDRNIGIDVDVEDGVTFFEGVIINSDVIDEVYKLMVKKTNFNRVRPIEKVHRVAWWDDRFEHLWNFVGDVIDPVLNARFLLYYSSLRPPEIAPVIRGMYYIFFKSDLTNLSILEDVKDEKVIRNTLGLNIAYGSIFDFDYLGVINFYKKFKSFPHYPFNKIKFSNKKI